MRSSLHLLPEFDLRFFSAVEVKKISKFEYKSLGHSRTHLSFARAYCAYFTLYALAKLKCVLLFARDLWPS